MNTILWFTVQFPRLNSIRLILKFTWFSIATFPHAYVYIDKMHSFNVYEAGGNTSEQGEKKANTYRRHIYVFHTKRTSAGICMRVSHFGGGKRYKHASRSHMQRNCVKYLFYSKLLIFITFVTEKGNRILSECTHKMFIRRHIGAR